MYRTTDPYATHQKFLEFYIKQTTGDIIEFGTGDGSTGFILNLIKDTGRKLVSLENNKEWYNKMLNLYPETEFHKYIFVEDWQTEISKLDKNAYSIVFIDQNPWEARQWTMEHFRETAEYVIVHDVDYFPRNNMFGTLISQFDFDFSDKFKKWKVYYPEHPWPGPTGPPTLVGSNSEKVNVYKI